jgi:hypothetical protein
MKTFRFFLPFLLTATAFCYELSLEGNFRGIVDNLENKHGKEESGTTFGTNTNLSFGYSPDKNNTILIGANHFQQFGDKKHFDFMPLISYKFQDETKKFLFGTVERLSFINYHDYILSKNWQFKNPTFQGTYFSQNFRSVNWSIWIDWTGLQSKEVHEEFIHGHDLSYTIKLNERNSLDLGWQFIYNHIASRDRNYHQDPVEDIGAFIGHLLYRLDEFKASKIKTIKGGVRGMFTYNRQREKSTRYYTNSGMEITAGIDFKRVMLTHSQYFKIADNSAYPFNLKTGDDRFFDNFGQSDISVRFLDGDFAKIDFTLSFIAIDGGLNNRQTMQVVVPIKVANKRD